MLRSRTYLLAGIKDRPLKSALNSQGYGSLILSEPSSFENECPGGVEFDYKEYTYYEIDFYLWKEKVLAVDITLGPPQ